ncbi:MULTISPECIES: helix-turn-helix domain-containing protein [Staphylococcus]|uniref:helix-turn-helix domain-containing protein n=1 Tax=Staphylococcus TaxID=1279 RepID=UPI002100196D|nr:helix-turn-helix domain-containing protein [Staphylococcus nepalensis]
MDTSKLKSKMIYNKVKLPKLLELLNEKGIVISKSSYYKRMRGEVEFSLTEIRAISEILELTPEDIMDIFFDHKVS